MRRSYFLCVRVRRSHVFAVTSRHTRLRMTSDPRRAACLDHREGIFERAGAQLGSRVRDAPPAHGADAQGARAATSPVSSPSFIYITVIPSRIPRFYRRVDLRRAAMPFHTRAVDSGTPIVGTHNSPDIICPEAMTTMSPDQIPQCARSVLHQQDLPG